MLNQKTVRHTVLLSLLCLSLIVYLVVSSYGVLEYRLLQKRVELMEVAVSDAEQQIHQLEEQLAAIIKDSFVYEQRARNDLCMGYPDEYVYLLR